jgi:ribosome-associated translation inhibitor RaiA
MSLYRRILDRRLRFSLGRWSTRLASVRAEVGDENGPRGGADKYCKLRATTSAGDELVVETLEPTVEAALDRAIDRLTRTLNRHLGRRREFRRESVKWASDGSS